MSTQTALQMLDSGILVTASAQTRTMGDISDKELLSLFKKVNNLSIEKKKTVKEFLEAFVFKADIQQKLA